MRLWLRSMSYELFVEAILMGKAALGPPCSSWMILVKSWISLALGVRS